MSEANSTPLEGVAATLLMPLWARALEFPREGALLRDPRAVEIMRSVAFDFDVFVKKRVPAVQFCMRGSIFDTLVRDHLQRAPESTVVELGAGLDARYERVDNGAAHWLEIDLPEVIRLRRRFFAETPRRTILSGSLLDTDWLDAVERLGCKTPLFVAEGVLYFLSRKEVASLFARLADRFPGSAIVFDAQSSLMLWVSNLRHPLSDSKLRFTVRGNASEIEDWDPRFHVRRYVGFGDSPYYDRAMDRLSWVKRLMARFPLLSRHAFKIVEVELG